jgi:hypothetical protein
MRAREDVGSNACRSRAPIASTSGAEGPKAENWASIAWMMSSPVVSVGAASISRYTT